jgi:hypothetical protein
VSLFCDKETISIAIFWDTRILGSFKMLSYETHNSFKTLGLDQYAKFSLETGFDMDQLLNR